MKSGRWNRGLGWLWLIVTFGWGLYVAANIETWMANDMGMVRTMHRHAHTMGSLGAYFNIMYGNRVSKGTEPRKAVLYSRW
ncbi:MAG: hypothetical protein SV253_04995 [Halobacteria archaeon]|nr:hypothetical protein [Halobacteria archaeon]